MLRGELYHADDPEIQTHLSTSARLLERYNATRHDDQEERDRLLRELLGEAGDGVVIRPPFYCDYGTYISIGAGTFVNYDCVMLDVAPIRIGESCQIATKVQLLTATHPVDPAPRRLGWESAVVTRDLPAGVVAFGNPCRVHREIGENDRVQVPDR